MHRSPFRTSATALSAAHQRSPNLTCLLITGVLLTAAAWSPVVAQDARTTAVPVAGVTAAILDESNWDQLAPAGKEVDAIYGDIVLKNAFLTAVIAQPTETRHANMTVRNIAGCLIDLAVNRHPSDQLSAFYPGRRKYAFRSVQITPAGDHPAAQVTVTAAATDTLPRCDVTWSLTPDARSLQVTSTWTNTTSAPVTLDLEDDLRADAGKEDMPKAPNATQDWFWFHDIHWQQACGIVPTGGQRIRSNSNARDSVLVYEPADGQPITLAPGAAYTLTRQILVETDLVRLRALLPTSQAQAATAPAAAQQTAGTLRARRLQVVDGLGQPVAGGRLTITSGDQPWGTLVLTGAASEDVPLPDGPTTFELQAAGLVCAKQQVVLQADTATAADSPALRLQFADYTPGQSEIRIADQDGQPLPAKIAFTGSAGTPTPNWGPETAEHFVRNLAYTSNGQVRTPLQAGQYDVTISRGPEYDAVFTRLQVAAGQTATLNIQLHRTVDTTGWVSADFHSHSSPSGDNTGSQLGRVLNLAAEHLEFAPCTEHNRVSTYAGHIQTLQLERFLATVSGIELTGQPLPLNHQNAFPLIYRPRTQDGGGPTADASPETQIERLAAWDQNSEKLIQQNHPDIGWLFYDRDGNQMPDGGYARSFGLMNVVEVHPIDPLLNLTPFQVREGRTVENQTVFNWLQLLNQGFRIYGVVNTDAHYNFHGSGGLRLWLKSSTDAPSELNADHLRDVARSGQIIMSNGPFLEAQFRETGSQQPAAIAGQDLSAASRRITADIRVQCANWMDIDTVFVLVNGRRRDDLVFTRDQHPDRFGSGPVKFRQSLEFAVEGDSHLIVVAGHRTERLGDVIGPAWGTQHPVALSNPVFVDVDGNGFRGNRDTLDSPLPVKFVAP